MFDKMKNLGKMTIAKEYRDEQLIKHDLIDLFWECTLSCNAKCKHCGSSAEGKNILENLQQKKQNLLLNKLLMTLMRIRF